MNTIDESQKKEEIKQIIKKINYAWVKNRTEDLVNFFYMQMVIVGPDFLELKKGQKACIKSYKDFIDRAKINNFKEEDATVYVYGDTAIASYGYDITYKMDKHSMNDSGRDMFVFIYGDKKWQTALRTMLSHT